MFNFYDIFIWNFLSFHKLVILQIIFEITFIFMLFIIQRRYFLKKNMNKMAAYTFIINKFYSRTTILEVPDLTILFY